MRHGKLLIAVALMLAVIAVACGSTESKPATEPPTPIPTVVVTPTSEVPSAGSEDGAPGTVLDDPAVRECISEQLGEDFDPESPDFGRSLLGRLGSDELAILEACGLDVSGGFGGARRVPGEGRTDGGFGAFGGIGGLGALADPEIQECLTGELGEDFELDFGSRGDDGSGQRGSGFTAGGFGEEFTTALEKCGVNFAGGDFARGADDAAFSKEPV